MGAQAGAAPEPDHRHEHIAHQEDEPGGPGDPGEPADPEEPHADGEQAYVNMGYEPLAQLAPEDDIRLREWSNSVYSDAEGDDSEAEQDEDDIDHDPEFREVEEAIVVDRVPENVPPIESVEREVTREVWGSPCMSDNIKMDQNRAREVMSAMANFTLPSSSFPEWARDVSEEEWMRRLAMKLNSEGRSDR